MIAFNCIVYVWNVFVCFLGCTYILSALLTAAVITVAGAKVVMNISAHKIGEGIQKSLVIRFRDVLLRKLKGRESSNVIKNIFDVGISDFDQFLYESKVKNESPTRVQYDFPQTTNF